MSDNQEITPEQAQEIINWAIGAGALLKLLDMRPDDLPVEEEADVLRHTVDTILENMPEFFADFVLDAGIELYEDFEETERLVEEFRKQLEGL